MNHRCSLLVCVVWLLHTASAKLDIECGKSNALFRRFNVRGGNEVIGHPWPWIASIRTIDSQGEEHVCAGTLIGERHILTAGHCVWDVQAGNGYGAYRNAEDLLVMMGTSKLLAQSGFGAGEKTFMSGVRRIHVHPKYRSPTVRAWAYDLALLELKKAPTFVDVARHACLPLGDMDPADGERCIAVGWGKTEDARYSFVLQEAVIPIVGRDECNRPSYWKNYVDQSMICAGDMQNESRASACQGDSGGPLVCLREDDHWYVYGVVSWGPMLCGDKPGVFTNVAKVAPWVAAVLRHGGEQLDYLDAIAKTLTTTPPPASTPVKPSGESNTPLPTTPCDAALFERKPGWIMFGPAPTQFLVTNVTENECMQECCARGAEECQSFVYFRNERKCRLRKVVRCSRSASFYKTRSSQPVNADVTYVGMRTCETHD